MEPVRWDLLNVCKTQSHTPVISQRAHVLRIVALLHEGNIEDSASYLPIAFSTIQCEIKSKEESFISNEVTDIIHNIQKQQH